MFNLIEEKNVHSMLFDDFKLHSESEYNFLNRELDGLYNLSFLIDRYFFPSVDFYKEFFKYFNPLKIDNAKSTLKLTQNVVWKNYTKLLKSYWPFQSDSALDHLKDLLHF